MLVDLVSESTGVSPFAREFVLVSDVMHYVPAISLSTTGTSSAARDLKSNVVLFGQSEVSELVVVDSLPRADLEVVSPFFVEVHREPEDVCAYHRDTELFGVGDTLPEALEDFHEALVELLERLSQERVVLGPALRRTLAILEGKIRRR